MVRKCKKCGKLLSDDSSQNICEYCRMKNKELRNNIFKGVVVGMVMAAGIGWKVVKSGGKTAVKIGQIIKNIKG